MVNTSYVWIDDKFVKSDDAKVNILTHSLQYGSGIFEGIRCYETKNGPAIFRLHDHIKRFFNSAKIYGMPLNFTPKQIEEAAYETVAKNKLRSAYIRPFAFYNDTNIGFSTKGKATSVAVAAVHFGNLFDSPNGLRCKVSSWQRINSSILPAGAKASGNYLNSIMASKEAQDSGYDEAILLTNSGRTVAEGPGENIFVVQDCGARNPSKVFRHTSWNNKRHHNKTRGTPRHFCVRKRHKEGGALHKRRGLLCRHGGADTAHNLCRFEASGDRQARTYNPNPEQ